MIAYLAAGLLFCFLYLHERLDSGEGLTRFDFGVSVLITFLWIPLFGLMVIWFLYFKFLLWRDSSDE